MRCLKRNQVPFWYCLYKGTRIPGDTSVAGEAMAGISATGDTVTDENRIYDEYGNETGESIPAYADPVKLYANISPATGLSQTEQFGGLENYDKVIVLDDTSCPINEQTVLFIDKEPEFTEAETYEFTESETLFGADSVERKTYRIPKYDYIVQRVAKSLNSVSIAVTKVKVR